MMDYPILILAGDWTDAVKRKCANLCDYDRPCYELAGNSTCGDETEIRPCAECAGET